VLRLPGDCDQAPLVKIWLVSTSRQIAEKGSSPVISHRITSLLVRDLLRENVQKRINKRIKLLTKDLRKDCKTLSGLKTVSDRINNTINKLHSIKSGKLLGIEPERLGNINNCEFLTYNDNLKKSSNNMYSLEEFNKICPAYGCRK